jgi:hypothetical protein
MKPPEAVAAIEQLLLNKSVRKNRSHRKHLGVHGTAPLALHSEPVVAMADQRIGWRDADLLASLGYVAVRVGFHNRFRLFGPLPPGP